jgi:hydrogenase maturation protease
VYSKTAVIGVGNILMRDDGLGVHLVKEITGHSLLPGSVRCIDGGTAPFEALYACGDCNNLVVVDAVKAGGKPGMIYKMTVEQWRGFKGISLHHTCLPDAVYMSRMFPGAQIPVDIIGMEPGDISPGLELSHAVRERFNDLVTCVLNEVKLKGNISMNKIKEGHYYAL